MVTTTKTAWTLLNLPAKAFGFCLVNAGLPSTVAKVVATIVGLADWVCPGPMCSVIGLAIVLAVRGHRVTSAMLDIAGDVFLGCE